MKMLKQIIVFVCLMLVQINCACAQNNKPDVSEMLLQETFEKYEVQAPVKRPFLNLDSAGLLKKINPFTYIAAGTLFVYQNVVSEQIQAQCCYEISCSNYMKSCIQYNGLIRGALMGLHQYNNCFGAIEHDYPFFKLNEKLQVINSSDFKK